MKTYFIRKDTKIPAYTPFPDYLMTADVSSSAKILYVRLLKRAQLSQWKSWIDESGSVFIISHMPSRHALLTSLCLTAQTIH